MASKERLHRHARHIALVGSDTLLGREIRDVLESSGSGIVVERFAANGEASFAEEEGEAVYREALSAATLKSYDAIVRAGSEAGALKAYELVESGRGGHQTNRLQRLSGPETRSSHWRPSHRHR